MFYLMWNHIPKYFGETQLHIIYSQPLAFAVQKPYKVPVKINLINKFTIHKPNNLISISALKSKHMETKNGVQ